MLICTLLLLRQHSHMTNTNNRTIYYNLYATEGSIAPQQKTRLTNLFVRFHNERRGRLVVTAVITGFVPAASRSRRDTVSVAISCTPDSIFEHDESVETSNSTDIPDGNPIRLKWKYFFILIYIIARQNNAWSWNIR